MFPALADKVSEARAFTREVLAGNPVVDSAELVVSELATNALQHSLSGQYGGPFIVAVETLGSSVRVSVVDLGSESSPTPGAVMPGPDTECGRGLCLVALLAKEWGSDRLSVGLRVWAELVADGAP